MSNPSRRPKDATGTQLGQGDSGDGIDTIWRSLGRLRAELRKMDHRLDGVVETGSAAPGATTTTIAAAVARHQQQHQTRGAAGMPGVSSSGETGPEGTKLSAAASTNHTGARRKVNRLDERKEEPSSRRSGQHKSDSGATTTGGGSGRRREPLRAKHQQTGQPPSRHQQHQQQQTEDTTGAGAGFREDSPKRVDFSKTHQLREVNWDGTYQDSLAYPADVSNSTLTNNRDIRETNVNFLNFSRVPGAAATQHPPSSSSTSNHQAPSSSVSASAAASSALAFRATNDNSNANNNARHSGSSTPSSSSPPYGPPPSLSNSTVNCRGLVLPPASSSSSASSVSSHHYHHNQHHPQQQQQQSRHQPISSHSSSSTDQHHTDVRWGKPEPAGHSSSSATRAAGGAASTGKGKPQSKAKLTQVDLKVVQGSRSAALSSAVNILSSSSNTSTSGTDLINPPASSSSSSSHIPPGQTFTHIRRQVEEKWALSKNNNRPSTTTASSAADTASASSPPPRRRAPFTADSWERVSPGEHRDYREGGARPRTANMEEPAPQLAALGAVGGVHLGVQAGDGEQYSPRRPRPIKMAITADLKEDEIMLKLKERLKQQRALASSSSASGSNDTSLADTSGSLAPPPALPPRQPLTGDSATQRPRKVAAAHPAPGYRGFSTEPSGEQHVSGGASGRPNSKVLGGAKKKSSVAGGNSKKQPQLQQKKHEPEVAATASRHPPPAPEQRPKKVARLIASSDKKSSKSGAKNIITTSSWRAGQELIMKELGLPPSLSKVKAKASQAGQGEGQERPSSLEGSSRTRGRSPDGAEAARDDDGLAGNNDNISDDPLVNEVVAKSKSLSEDTRHMLHDLQLGNVKEALRKERSPHRPPKRKAPKSSGPNQSDQERQQQPSEKTRHYDADSVRRFMAKQKAERLKRQQEEKLASQKASERRQKMMDKLAETQKAKAAASSVKVTLPTDTDKKKRKEGKGASKANKENSDVGEDHDDDSTLTGETEEELTPQATPRGDRDDEGKRRRRPLDQDLEDMDWREPAAQQDPVNTTVTLGSTPGLAAQPLPSGTTTIEFRGQKLNLDLGSVFNRFSQVVNQRAAASGMPDSATATSLTTTTAAAAATSETRLNNHPVPAPRTSVGGSLGSSAEGVSPFELGTSNAMSRTNEERKQAIKATALTLQSRLAEERRKLEELKFAGEPSPSHPHSTLAEYQPRYDRIAGGGDSFSVFTSNLPGCQVGLQSTSRREREEEAAARIQAAYRGHSVRGALNWGLPSGDTLGHRLRGVTKDVSAHSDDGAGGDASEVTETSSFSEITATEASGDNASPANPAAVAGNRRSQQRHRRHADGASKTGATSGHVGSRPVKPTHQPLPSSHHLGMPEPQVDPQSVMSIFTRQSKYLAAGSPSAAPKSTNASSANTAYLADLDLTDLKQPVITQTEHVVHGHTPSGQPMVAKTRYTRLEATVNSRQGDTNDDDASSTASESAANVRGGVSTGSKLSQSRAASVRSNDPSVKVEKMNRQSSQKSVRSDAYTLSFESDEDDGASATLTAGGVSQHKHSQSAAAKKSGASLAYNRQVSDGGLETDVSQMSEDEPRVMRSKFDGSASHHHQHSQARAASNARAQTTEGGATQGRLSPNSLANKLSAGLNHLESMEESLRQVVGMERVRAVALAQQETVSLAQVLKARQQEHSSELRQLQAQAQQEALEATKQLEGIRSRPSAAALLKTEDNLRPESRTNTSLSASRSTSRVNTAREDLSQSPGNRRIKRTSATASLASVTKFSTATKGSRDISSTGSVKTAADSSRRDSDSSIKSASDADGADSRTAGSASIAEEISGAVGGRRNDDDDASYSMAFDESITDEESFRQVLPSESHRKELRQQEMSQASPVHDVSSSHLTAYGDLSSLFVGEDSFNKFTAEMVRQIMREEEYRAQHQAALLSLREKALREKAKAELAWLQQLKKKPLDKRADDVFPNIDKREKRIRKNLQEQQAEIRRLQEANKVASQERQMLLQQHEEIARIKQNTNKTLNKLKSETPTKGRLARPSEVHTEDEVEEGSEVSEDVKDSKSDSEVYRDVSPSKKSKGDKKSLEKQRKLRLDQKYMTAREQKLHDRKKQAEELLEWKRRLDAEEAEIYRLERQAMDAWGEGKKTPTGRDRRSKDKPKKATTANKTTTPGPSRRPAAATADDVSTAAISEHMTMSAHDKSIKESVKVAESGRKGAKTSPAASTAKARSQSVQGSISEVISTQLSLSQSDSETTNNKSRSRTSAITTATGATAAPSGAGKGKQRSNAAMTASGSESSIPEEVPDGEEKKKALDSSDETLINSSANDDYADTFEHDLTSLSQRKKSPVGKLLPQGNSPLPTPWSRSKTGSESESEDSISHTETMSDASDYEVRIRHLSDELQRRRKEVEILKKERSRRKKEKFKAQEEALKKQLDAYSIYIQQLKDEKDDLEQHDQSLKSGKRPLIKQPGSAGKGGASPGTSPGAKPGSSRHGDEPASNSSSFEDMRESTESILASPASDRKDGKLSPADEKTKKKAVVSLMDRISEGSESDKSAASRKAKANQEAHKKPRQEDASDRSSSSMQEMIEEASQLDSVKSSDKTSSAALKIKTSAPADQSIKENSITEATGLKSLKDDDASYSMDFSEAGSTLAQSHSKVTFGARAQDASIKDSLAAGGRSEAGDISEHIIAEDPSSVASVGKSQASASSAHQKFDLRAGGSKEGSNSAGGPGSAAHSVAESLPPSTGIQESDSETESRVNSYHTSAKSEGSSRPSSERSLSYSAEDDEEENEQDQEEQDNQTQIKMSSPAKSLPPVAGAKPANVAATASMSKATEDDISEHISGSLPSISDKQGGNSHSNSLAKDSQDILDNLLGYDEGQRHEEEDEDDKTPVPTPREMLPLDEDEEENLSLLMTDPLADFTLGDRVLVYGGQKSGTLRYKGKVDFSPGIWAGVELDQPVGEHDGMQEGTRYFSCAKGHGVIVQGSDIMSLEKDGEGMVRRERLTSEDGRSADESFTTEDSKAEDGMYERSPARDESILHSTPLGSPQVKHAGEKPTETPVRRPGDRHSRSLLAEAITEQLEASLVQDSLEAVVGRLSNQSSPVKRTPPSLPSTPPPTQPRPEKLSNGSEAWDSELPEDQGKKKTGSPTSPATAQKTERTTDGVMRSLLDEAISDMVRIKKRKAQAAAEVEHGKVNTKVNGDLGHKVKEALLNERPDSANDEGGDDEDEEGDYYHYEDKAYYAHSSSEENVKDDSGLSLDHVHRPASPIPGDAPTEEDRQNLNDEISGLFGEYIDDDMGFERQQEQQQQHDSSSSTEAEEQASELSTRLEPELIPPVVPNTKEDITPIVSDAVSIFWQSRRFGESLEDVVPPESFLHARGAAEQDEQVDLMTAKSRQSWRRMLFDLTGEVIRDIYQNENKPEPPVWEKAQHSSHKFFKGSSPPTTMEGLLPLVQKAVGGMLNLDAGGFAAKQESSPPAMVNKWNIRKKKDAVDAVLVSELAREEKGWVNYDEDELNLKMALADSLFDSLLADTVSCLNDIYQRRSAAKS